MKKKDVYSNCPDGMVNFRYKLQGSRFWVRIMKNFPESRAAERKELFCEGESSSSTGHVREEMVRREGRRKAVTLTVS